MPKHRNIWKNNQFFRASCLKSSHLLQSFHFHDGFFFPGGLFCKLWSEFQSSSHPVVTWTVGTSLRGTVGESLTHKELFTRQNAPSGNIPSVCVCVCCLSFSSLSGSPQGTNHRYKHSNCIPSGWLHRSVICNILKAWKQKPQPHTHTLGHDEGGGVLPGSLMGNKTTNPPEVDAGRCAIFNQKLQIKLVQHSFKIYRSWTRIESMIIVYYHISKCLPNEKSENGETHPIPRSGSRSKLFSWSCGATIKCRFCKHRNVSYVSHSHFYNSWFPRRQAERLALTSLLWQLKQTGQDAEKFLALFVLTKWEF